MTKFYKNLKELNDQLTKTAGKPLEELTEQEKANVVLRWALARKIEPKKPISVTIVSVLVMGVIGVFFASLLALTIKWLFVILGVL